MVLIVSTNVDVIFAARNMGSNIEFGPQQFLSYKFLVRLGRNGKLG